MFKRFIVILLLRLLAHCACQVKRTANLCIRRTNRLCAVKRHTICNFSRSCVTNVNNIFFMEWLEISVILGIMLDYKSITFGTRQQIMEEIMKFKKIISTLLVCAMVFAMLPLGIISASAVPSDGSDGSLVVNTSASTVNNGDQISATVTLNLAPRVIITGLSYELQLSTGLVVIAL